MLAAVGTLMLALAASWVAMCVVDASAWQPSIERILAMVSMRLASCTRRARIANSDCQRPLRIGAIMSLANRVCQAHVLIVPIEITYSPTPTSVGTASDYVAALSIAAETIQEEISELRTLLADISPGGMALRYIEGVWECDMSGVWATGRSARDAMVRCQQIVVCRASVRECILRGDLPLDELQDVACVELLDSSQGICVVYDMYRDTAPLMG